MAAGPSMFGVFRNRAFATLWTAQFVSTVGSSLTDLSAGLLVYKITGSALNVGLVLMTSAVPTLLVGLVAGVFVDRYDRKRILQASDLLRGLLVFLIPFGVESGLGLIALYVLLLASSSVRQFFDPAWESVLPEIADEEELASANSFLAISSFGSTAIGFGAAGVLFSVNEHLPFFVDAATFVVSFLLVSLVRIKSAPVDETTSVAVVVENLRLGASYLWSTPILRSVFLVGLPVFLSFGLWNVLLLPMALKVFGATEAQYGLQEGLTSVGFAVAALTMAKLADRLPEGQWMVAATIAMGVCGVAYGFSPNIWIGIVFVVASGFFNSPMSIARRTILQKNIPREMRGRVFSAMFVMRDVVFLVGMGMAGLADVFDPRTLVIASSLLLVLAGIWTQFMPGLGRPAAEWLHAAQLLRTAAAAPSAAAGRAATILDLDRLIAVVPELRAFDAARRRDFLTGALVRRASAGQAIVKVGDAGDAVYFVLDGHAVAGIPTPDGSSRSLSAMGVGDFFGEIAALTGSPRTANVVADADTTLLEVPATTLKAFMTDPAVERLVRSKLSERVLRSQDADLVRLAGLDQRDLRDLRRRRHAPARSAATPPASPAD